MRMEFQLVLTSLMLGVGLAMDAFSVSVANGLANPTIKGGKITFIAGVFAIFQALMPLIGYFCVHTFLEYFKVFEKAIPYIALALLTFIGVKTIMEGTKPKCDITGCRELSFSRILIQGVATSIDALSVGFTLATYNPFQAVISSFIIGVVTFIICLAGVIIGQKVGGKLSGKAEIIGGIVLIIIGLEIFITSFL